MPNFVRARCQLIPDFSVAAAVCLAMMALFAGMAILKPPHDFEGWAAGAAMLGLWGATPFYWLVATRRGCIEFDANGARWRTAFGVARAFHAGGEWKRVDQSARG